MADLAGGGLRDVGQHPGGAAHWSSIQEPQSSEAFRVTAIVEEKLQNAETLGRGGLIAGIRQQNALGRGDGDGEGER